MDEQSMDAQYEPEPAEVNLRDWHRAHEELVRALGFGLYSDGDWEHLMDDYEACLQPLLRSRVQSCE